MKETKTIFIAIFGLVAMLVFVMYSGIQIQEQSISSMATGTNDGIVKRMQPFSYATCTAASGYDNCDQNSYNYGNARAAVKMHSTELQGKNGYGTIEGQTAHYYIDEVYMNVKLDYGDEIYVRRGSTAWNSCGRDYCGGQNLGKSAKYVIANAPAKNPAHVDFTGYDFDGDAWGYGYWTWTAVFRGWVEADTTFDFYVIGCYSDADGNGINEYCDKSGTWDTWELKTDEYAHLPQIKYDCDGYSYNEYSRVRGTDTYEFTKIVENNAVRCGYDATKPNISINSPLNGSVVNVGYAVVSGTTDDNVAVTEIMVNGISVLVADEWVSNVSLDVGINTITATVHDENNINTDTIEVEYIDNYVEYVTEKVKRWIDSVIVSVNMKIDSFKEYISGVIA